MNISKNEEIAGFPAIKLRTLFRNLVDQTFSPRDITTLLDISLRKSNELMKALEEQGYIQAPTPPRRESKDKKDRELSIKGCGLAMASAAPQIKRVTADRLITGLLERVEIINNSPDFLHSVTKVILFGSYLDESRSTLGDIDIAYEVELKELNMNNEKYIEKIKKLAKSDGKNLSFMNMLFYPEEKLKRFLRNRSRAISLHSTFDGVLKTGIPQKVIYPK